MVLGTCLRRSSALVFTEIDWGFSLLIIVIGVGVGAARKFPAKTRGRIQLEEWVVGARTFVPPSCIASVAGGGEP